MGTIHVGRGESSRLITDIFGVFMRFKWPVVPICEKQLLDVREEDLLEGGLYRTCDTYRGGGGYDQFNKIWEKRKGYSINPVQFVVQLYGCPLNCPYCYVTSEGYLGEKKLVDRVQMLYSYNKTGLDVFHLMGGAPALYLPHWKSIHKQVKVFHSDFLLVEGKYDIRDLRGLAGLHAVSIKEPSIYTEQQRNMLWANLERLMEANVDFYITFTGEPVLRDEIARIFGERVLDDSFVIDIKNYNAIEVTE